MGNVIPETIRQRRAFGVAAVRGKPAATPMQQPGNAAAAATGSAVLMVFAAAVLINFFGRPFEKFLSGLHIPSVVSILAAVAAVFLGGLAALKTRVALAISAFAVWMACCIPFSLWQGGSFRYVRSYVLLKIALLCIVAAAPRSFSDLKKLISTVAIACMFHLQVGARFTAESGRLSGTGTYGNADDVALLAGFALPLWVFMSWQIKNVFIRAAVGLGGGGLLLRMVGLTATRSAFLALLVMAGLLLWRCNALQRVVLVLFGVVACSLLVLTLPSHSLERLRTISSSFDLDRIEAGNFEGEALHSTAERLDLTKDGLKTILAHPITGVGPGEFSEHRYLNLKTSTGRAKRWFPSHNTYLQIGSESGLPGLFLYVLFLAMVYRTIRVCRRLNIMDAHDGWQTGRQMCLMLELALVYFVLCAIFMTCDVHPHQFVIAGLAVALERISRTKTAGGGTQPQTNGAKPLPPGPVPARVRRPL